MRLRPYFERETGQAFVSGIKVLVKVTVDFHELYGYSLTVVDIDPTYTLGDMARRRREILKRLEDEGVLTLNKELDFPYLTQRIALFLRQRLPVMGTSAISCSIMHGALSFMSVCCRLSCRETRWKRPLSVLWSRSIRK